jgi:hypothetical protein
MTSQSAAFTPAPSTYGTHDKRAAIAKEISAGNWQVKTHDPRNRAAGHDGWVLLGTGYPTLAEACAATGMSY